MSDCCVVEVPDRIVKLSSALFTFSFFDIVDNDEPVTPNSITWTLEDTDGNEIDTGTLAPAEIVNLMLTGVQLDVPTTNPTRNLILVAPYTQSEFGVISLREIYQFVICDE